MSEGKKAHDLGGAADFALPSLVAAAHELKAPLAVVRQLALAIQDEAAEPDDIMKMVERITLTSERALRLTSDLTQGSRLQDALFELEPLDVLPLCRDVVDELSPLYRARGHELVMSRSRRGLPLAVGHRDLLRRILINFADNALHYATADGRVELFATYRRKDDIIRLGVRDYGPGLESNIKFFERPAKLTYRPTSSGLGLYLAKQFAEAMNAEVGVTRHRDGASFYVDIAKSTQLRLL